MINNILFIFASSPSGVRIGKEVSFLKSKGFSLSYVGWNRSNKKFEPNPMFDDIVTLQRGGKKSGKILPMLYIVYMVKLFFHLLFRRGLKNQVIFAINFESAYIVWLVSHFKKVNYIYDIWDELAISHSFPLWLVKAIRRTDAKIRKDSNFYIHVDENRISEIDSDNYIIVYNSPLDFFNGSFPTERKIENTFAVTGWLNNTRGLESIYEFALHSPDIKFIVAGGFRQEEFEKKYRSLPNVECHSFMPQQELFKLIWNCRGIFSLYDTKIPINRLAASNKLYDAMMLGVPVIVNNDLAVAGFVSNNKVGYIVNYDYDESWNDLKEIDERTIRIYGENGRQLFVSRFEFSTMMESEFMPAFAKYIS